LLSEIGILDVIDDIVLFEIAIPDADIAIVYLKSASWMSTSSFLDGSMSTSSIFVRILMEAARQAVPFAPDYRGDAAGSRSRPMPVTSCGSLTGKRRGGFCTTLPMMRS
jgi:hypothetical protein